MKTKNTNDELPSYPKHFVSRSCGGERCYCGNDATHKVGEEIPHDEKDSYPEPLKGLSIRHNFTQYVCCQCFTNIMGNAVFCDYTRPAPAKIERDVVERAKAHWVAAAACFDALRQPRDLDETMIGMLASFAAAETADLNAKLDAVREALGKLTEVAADVRDVFCPQNNQEAQALINLTSELAKAKAILNNDAKDSPERA